MEIVQDAPPPRVKAYVPYVTIALVAANVIVFVLSVGAGADFMHPTADKMYELGGNFGPVTLNGGWWRLFSSMFLHYGVLHIGMNMLGLFDGGRHVERMYGRAAFAAIYLFAGLAGGLASALPGKAVSAGASGAIFGIFGAFGAFLLLHRRNLDAEVVKKQSRGLMIFLVYNIWFGLQAKGIDMFAHFGGLGAGFIAGLVLAAPRARIAKSIVVGVVGSALVIGATFVVPKPTSRVFLGATKAALDKFATIEQSALDRYNKLVKDRASDPDMTDDAMAKVIDDEVLPAWHDAKAAVAHLEGVPPTMVDAMHTYVDTRERAFTELAAALHASDQAAVKRGMVTMHEADADAKKLLE